MVEILQAKIFEIGEELDTSLIFSCARISSDSRFAQSLIFNGMVNLIVVTLFPSPREKLVREYEMEESDSSVGLFTEIAGKVGRMF